MRTAQTNPTAQSRALTALVADPDDAQRQQIAASLGAGYRIIAARYLAEAAQMIEAHHPQVLVLELNQPDGAGLQLVQRLRANPKTRNMVIACVTARRGVRDKIAGFQAGADDYVVKPVDMERLPWRLALLLRLRSTAS